MANATQGRRPTGPGEYWYDGTYPGDYGPERYEGPVSTGITFAWLTGDEKEYPIDDMPGDFVPLTKPVAGSSPDEDREPSWQDYAALSLHDLAWLREMAEEYEWSHRADPGVDMERVRMVIGRMTIALHKRKEVQSE